MNNDKAVEDQIDFVYAYVSGKTGIGGSFLLHQISLLVTVSLIFYLVFRHFGRFSVKTVRFILLGIILLLMVRFIVSHWTVTHPTIQVSNFHKRLVGYLVGPRKLHGGSIIGEAMTVPQPKITKVKIFNRRLS